MGKFHRVTVILVAGAAIWFIVGFVDLAKGFLAWLNAPEGFTREAYSLSNFVYSMLDSLFMLGSAAMVEYLSRIHGLLVRRTPSE
jgi:hypothetical protein